MANDDFDLIFHTVFSPPSEPLRPRTVVHQTARDPHEPNRVLVVLNREPDGWERYVDER